MGKMDLSNIINKCCDILRTDDGISGAMHYTEVLSWILYLKFLQDKELQRKESAELEGIDYVPIIEEKYLFNSWGNTLTGNDLIKFLNEDLFPALKNLKINNNENKSLIIKQIFSNTTNRVNSGYLLKDVIEEIKKIDFEIYDQDSNRDCTLSHIYEDLLKNMGEGGGNSGEFYTPRPLIRMMVKLIKPLIGETVYDPACGTGGFLAEAYEFMKAQLASDTNKVMILKEKTFYAQEKTPLPYLLCLMNLTLHGIDFPHVMKTNTLQDDISNLTEKDKHDVKLANPPFGGKEQKNIQSKFKIQSNATELLFLQHIERKLRNSGRAAIIIPEGVLFQTATAYKSFKEELLQKYNLHSVISLPAGIFLPYSAVKTSVIFFDKSKKTENIWFYEVPLKDGEKLTKKNSIRDEHFQDLLEIFDSRIETARSWLIPVEQVFQKLYNLSASSYNPHNKTEEDLLDPVKYAEEIKKLLDESAKSLQELILDLR
jgi:type I restriction enzyme M protein